MSSRIAVVGAGGVGGYFGARLAQAGNNVSFLARGAHLRALQAHGLRLASPLGDCHLSPAQAAAAAEEIGAVDLVLVAVKAWQVREAARSLGPLLGEETYVLPLQNGVEAPGELAEVLGAERVLGGLCKIVSLIEEPGKIRHLGAEPFIALGELGRSSTAIPRGAVVQGSTGVPGTAAVLGNSVSPRVTALATLLRDAGIKVETPEHIENAMWQKFLFIAAVSGVGAVSRANLGSVREIPETRALLRSAMEEIVAVAAGLAIPLPGEVVDRTLAFVDSLPAETTASMQRDLMEGRPSELEQQNGAVVRLGLEAQVPTPLHAFLYACLLPMERKARSA